MVVCFCACVHRPRFALIIGIGSVLLGFRTSTGDFVKSILRARIGVRPNPPPARAVALSMFDPSNNSSGCTVCRFLNAH